MSESVDATMVVKVLVRCPPMFAFEVNEEERRLEDTEFLGCSARAIRDTTPVPTYLDGQLVGKAHKLEVVRRWGHDFLLYTVHLSFRPEKLDQVLRHTDGALVGRMAAVMWTHGISPTKLILQLHVDFAELRLKEPTPPASPPPERRETRKKKGG